MYGVMIIRMTGNEPFRVVFLEFAFQVFFSWDGLAAALIEKVKK